MRLVNLQTLGLQYSTGRVGDLILRPSAEPLIKLLSLIQGEHLRTLVLVVSLSDARYLKPGLHFTFDNPQWRALDELISDVKRFAVVGKIMLVLEYIHLDDLLERFELDSIFGLVDTVKMAFKGLTSTRQLQLVLKCVTIFILNLSTNA